MSERRYYLIAQRGDEPAVRVDLEAVQKNFDSGLFVARGEFAGKSVFSATWELEQRGYDVALTIEGPTDAAD